MFIENNMNTLMRHSLLTALKTLIITNGFQEYQFDRYHKNVQMKHGRCLKKKEKKVIHLNGHQLPPLVP